MKVIVVSLIFVIILPSILPLKIESDSSNAINDEDDFDFDIFDETDGNSISSDLKTPIKQNKLLWDIILKFLIKILSSRQEYNRMHIEQSILANNPRYRRQMNEEDGATNAENALNAVQGLTQTLSGADVTLSNASVPNIPNAPNGSNVLNAAPTDFTQWPTSGLDIVQGLAPSLSGADVTPSNASVPNIPNAPNISNVLNAPSTDFTQWPTSVLNIVQGLAPSLSGADVTPSNASVPNIPNAPNISSFRMIRLPPLLNG